MKPASFVTLLILLLPGMLLAQAPAANAPAKVAVVDFNRVVVESTNGKKAAAEFTAEMTKLRSGLEATQKSIAENEEKLRTQQNVLSDAAKADLARKIEVSNTQLTRDTEDAEKTAAEKQNVLFGPIAQLAKTVLDAYAAESGYSVVFDSSSQATNIIFVNDLADITTEIIRRVDAEAAKAAPAAPAAPKP